MQRILKMYHLAIIKNGRNSVVNWEGQLRDRGGGKIQQGALGIWLTMGWFTPNKESAGRLPEIVAHSGFAELPKHVTLQCVAPSRRKTLWPEPCEKMRNQWGQIKLHFAITVEAEPCQAEAEGKNLWHYGPQKYRKPMNHDQASNPVGHKVLKTPNNFPVPERFHW